jgi:hypothetical protein
MGMPRGLAKITNYYNRLEAQRDWEKAVLAAGNVPIAEIVAVAPKPEYGWRRIDKCTAKLKALIAKVEETK